MPYSSLEDLRSANPGLGIINESDAWLTGRPYGLPGTATVELIQRPGGYGNNPNGAHYNARMFGDASVDMVMQLQQIAVAQQAQEKALKRIAFWQTVAGGLTIAGLAAGLALAFFKD